MKITNNMKNGAKLISLMVLIFIAQFHLGVSYSEMETIPYTHAYYDSTWLKNDWYLHSKIDYRHLFSFFTGFFVSHFGFLKTVYAGRILSYFLFSFSFLSLLRSLQISFMTGFFTLVIFFYYFNQNISAGEWMIGGLETKVFAYCFLLLSLSCFIRDNFKWGFLLAGLAFSFHFMIGGYFLFGLSALLLYKYLSSRLQIRDLLKHSYWLLITGCLGFYGVFKGVIMIFHDINPKSEFYWEYYVKMREPHHTLPLWGKQTYLFFAIFIGFHLFILLKKNVDQRMKDIAVFSISGFVFTVIGLMIYFFGNITNMRFFFFRFSDSMLPLLTLLLLLHWMLNLDVEKYWEILKGNWKKTVVFSWIVISIVLFSFNGISNFKKIVTLKSKEEFDPEMAKWIKAQTSKNSVFLIPIDLKTFYTDVERACFVTFKHCPHNSVDFIEWYNRLKILNKNMHIKNTGGLAIDEINFNYNRLTELEIMEIGKKYKIDYIITSSTTKLQFKKCFLSSKYSLYKLDSFFE